MQTQYATEEGQVFCTDPAHRDTPPPVGALVSLGPDSWYRVAAVLVHPDRYEVQLRPLTRAEAAAAGEEVFALHRVLVRQARQEHQP